MPVFRQPTDAELAQVRFEPFTIPKRIDCARACPKCGSIDFYTTSGGIDALNKRSCKCGHEWLP